MNKFFVFLAIMVACVVVGLVSFNKLPQQENNYKRSCEITSNTKTHLQSGGRVESDDEYIYYSFSSKTKGANSIFRKSKTTNEITEIKKFFFTIPGNICTSKNYVFFDLSASFATGSPLYRITKNGSGMKQIIKDVVNFYIVFNEKIFYSLDNDGTDAEQGVYSCDLNGKNKTKIINEDVSEFLCDDTGIFYIVKDTVKRYEFDTNKSVIITQLENQYLYSLMQTEKNLFVIAHDSLHNYMDNWNEQEKILYKLDVNDNTCEEIFRGNIVSVHILKNDTFLIQNVQNCIVYDVVELSYQPILDGYVDILDIYTFGNAVFFYKYDDNNVNEEHLYHISLEDMNVNLIQ